MDINQFFIPENDKESQEMFATLLTLDDEEFAQISPFVLAEIIKTFNDINFRKTILMPAYTKLFDGKNLVTEREAIFKAIDDSDLQLSEVKKDFLKRICILGINTYEEELGKGAFQITVPMILREGAKMPEYGSEEAAGIDLYAIEDVTINPGETKIIPTGIRVSLPKGYALLIHPRSGLSARTKLRIANSVGLIDADYQDEIGVIMENTESPISNILYDFDPETHKPIITGIEHGKSYTIAKGDRFAQMRLVKAPQINFEKVNNFLDTNRDRGGGFGHTGK